MTETAEKNEALFEAHGVSPEYTREQGLAVGRALLIALGVAGRIPREEMARFLEIATEYGATPDESNALQKFDYRNARLDEQIDLTPSLARHLMYEATRIVRAAAPPGPAPKLKAVSRVLRVHPAVAAGLDAVIAAEDALRRMRATVDAMAVAAATANGSEGGPSLSASASLHTIHEREQSLREMRLRLMEEETKVS